MKKGIFITGTDTDVGKTYVGALLVKSLRKRGIDAGYYKPVLSGAYRENGVLIPEDAAYVAKEAGLKESPTDLVSYIFEEGVSPHLAGARQGIVIEKEKILADFEELRKTHEFMVVEGAGGITCPLSMGTSPLLIADIIKYLALPAIIVGHSGLGGINHAVLTAAYGKAQGISIKGFVLNHFEKGNFLHEDNKKQIEALTGVPILGCVASHD